MLTYSLDRVRTSYKHSLSLILLETSKLLLSLFNLDGMCKHGMSVCDAATVAETTADQHNSIPAALVWKFSISAGFPNYVLFRVSFVRYLLPHSSMVK